MEVPVYHLQSVVKTRTELADFDGPLDLILALLSKNKMEIQDIQISLILEQYLAWMDRRKELDLEVASEFVTMAAQLVYIKTRMLLSIHDEEAISEMEQLIASLEERQRHENLKKIKAVVPTMLERYEVGRDYIARTQETVSPDKTYRYVHRPEDIRSALLTVFTKGSEQLPPPQAAFQGIVGREPYPVGNKAMEILRRLVRSGVTRFKSLFQNSRSRSEIVATFLAVLELCKSSKVSLAGSHDECTVIKTDSGAEDDMEQEVPTA
ncbi:MAG: segregation/condensation protein A [Oscillospiraceae bacterium]|nr:segregation/condensation protein A [Oscillospiraceae bacterium]